MSIRLQSILLLWLAGWQKGPLEEQAILQTNYYEPRPPSPLNIAEGAGEFSTREKMRFYRMARRSATECAAILDICRRLEMIETENYEAGRKVLLRIVSRLIQMARQPKRSGTGRKHGRGPALDREREDF
jgi:hypothetical protein